jgi:hypothetical protein
MKYMVGAVDTVRKAENRALNGQGDKTLAGSKYLWLYSALGVARGNRRNTGHTAIPPTDCTVITDVGKT